MLLVLGCGHESMHQLAHRRRAHEPRFEATPGVQQAIGEDVTAFVVRGELHLVDRHEVNLVGERHRFGRADPIIRAAWHAFLFSRDQRHAVFADTGGNAVVDLAGQQPQWQADHAAVMFEQTFYGAVRLTRVGRSEQRDTLSGIRQRHQTSMPRQPRLC